MSCKDSRLATGCRGTCARRRGEKTKKAHASCNRPLIMTFDANSLQGGAGGPLGLLAISLVLSILAILISAIALWRWRRQEARIAAVSGNGAAAETARQL